ncbi:MAG: hypothetical protein J07HX64_02346 [halophilic archaeon J07HX64]|nr:MAG: hypothetical protein J07HX64_02346 [halophilic archaeon J07HX64]
MLNQVVVPTAREPSATGSVISLVQPSRSSADITSNSAPIHADTALGGSTVTLAVTLTRRRRASVGLRMFHRSVFALPTTEQLCEPL